MCPKNVFGVHTKGAKIRTPSVSLCVFVRGCQPSGRLIVARSLLRIRLEISRPRGATLLLLFYFDTGRKKWLRRNAAAQLCGRELGRLAEAAAWRLRGRRTRLLLTQHRKRVGVRLAQPAAAPDPADSQRNATPAHQALAAHALQ